MAETVNQGAGTSQAADTTAGAGQAAGTNQGTEKTFTQAELDAIVSDRLKRERTKYQDYDSMKEKAAKWDQQEEASKTELQKEKDKTAALQKELDGIKNANKLKELRDKVAKETGVPAELLTGETEEACKDQAKNILAFAKGSGYPVVKDGGEVTKPTGQGTRDQFAKWFEEAMG